MRRYNNSRLPHRGLFLVSLLFIVLILGAGLGGVASGSVYDFDSLGLGTLFGQDNWTDYSSEGDDWDVQIGGGVNTSQTARGSHVVIRQSDSNWGFTAHQTSDTTAVMQFDFRYIGGTGRTHYFGLGGDSANASDGTDSTVDDLNERGPAFGYVSSSNTGNSPSFVIRDLAKAPSETGTGVTEVFQKPVSSIGGVSGGDWIRLKMTIDFTQFGGDGGGRLYYANLTDGGSGFTELTTSAVNLRISDMWDDVEDPATWDTLLMVSTGDGNPQFDNLVANAKGRTIRENFDNLNGNTLPGGWSLFDTGGGNPEPDAVYQNVSRDSGLAGRVESKDFSPSDRTEMPGAYIVSPTSLETSQGFFGRFDIYLEDEGTTDDGIFFFGDIGNGLTDVAADALSLKLIESGHVGTPPGSHLANGADNVLVDGGPQIDDETWHRVEFRWSPTSGTTGDFIASIYRLSDNAFLGSISLAGFTFDPEWVQFGFGSLNDTVRFDNIWIATVPEPGTLLVWSLMLALGAGLAWRRRRR